MIGKKKKVRAKCPICGRITVEIERKTTTQRWLKYECYLCKIPFMLPKHWRKNIQPDPKHVII